MAHGGRRSDEYEMSLLILSKNGIMRDVFTLLSRFYTFLFCFYFMNERNFHCSYARGHKIYEDRDTDMDLPRVGLSAPRGKRCMPLWHLNQG